MPAYKSDVVRCYHLLGQAFDKNSKYINMPKVRYVPHIDSYSTLDYINPHYNHIYKDVYGHKFSLPKMYRNVFTNTQPSTRMIEIKPKQGVSFKEAKELRQNFIKNPRSPKTDGGFCAYPATYSVLTIMFISFTAIPVINSTASRTRSWVSRNRVGIWLP